VIDFKDLPAQDKIYYQDDAAVIYCADNREVLPLFPDKAFDLVLTDPPYGLKGVNDITHSHSRQRKAVPKDYGVCDWDDKPIDQSGINQIIFKAEHSIIFGGNYYCLPASPCWLVWDKDNSGDFADCELAWTNFTSAVKKYLWRCNGMLQEPNSPKEFRYHPTQKPQGLFRAILINYSNYNESILDPFLGSGTTAVAAKILGRKCVGIEISEKYCEIAAKRLSQSVMQLEIPKETIQQGKF